MTKRGGQGALILVQVDNNDDSDEGDDGQHQEAAAEEEVQRTRSGRIK